MTALVWVPASPVPLGMVVGCPGPGRSLREGNVKDWPGVGAGVGPVPLGTDELPVDPPVVDPALLPELAPPLLDPLDPLLCPNADTVLRARTVAVSK